MAGFEESVLFEKPSGAGPSGSVTLATERMNLVVKVQRGVFHLETLYLFTRSDVKTVLVPQIIFIMSAVLSGQALTTGHRETAGEAVQRLPLAILWIWLNLIAQRLLLGMIPLTVGISAALGGFKPTLTMMTLLWMYNDLDGSSINIWARNAINTGGIMCFSAGSLEVLSRGELLPKSWAWIGLTGVAIATTVQALDFPDMEGDNARGRKTIPLLYGENVARVGLAVMVLIWSIVCPTFWDLRLVFWTAPVGVGILMAALTILRRDEKSDHVVAKLWCLWMSVVYILPIFTA
ncbi:ubiA prenyltransferase [Colletotrichum tofieldiae]|nr:ubiA prenyltransferase [Colletotrichum tofieldiae]